MKINLTNIKTRSIVFFSVLSLIFVVLIGRTAYWQTVRGSELKTAALEQQTGESEITASRGDIYDRNGKTLASSGSVNTLVCNPQDVEKKGDAEYAARAIAPIIDMDEDKVLELLTKENRRYQVIKKRLSVEQAEAVKALKAMKDSDGDGKADEDDVSKKFTGIYFEEDSKRYYSFGIAPHVVGFTGYDNNGLQGVELKFDSYLTGTAGSISSLQQANGETLTENEMEYVTAPSEGADVVLTIDETIQQFLEKHLETAISEYKLKEGAAGIIMDPTTGEILAMASKPDFDPNDPNNTAKIESMLQSFDYTVLANAPSSKEPTESEEEEYENEKDALESYGKEMTRMKLLMQDAENLASKEEGDDFDKEAFEEEYEQDYKIKNREFFSSLYLSDEEIQQRLTVYLRNRMWRNKAISDSYEPGSAFKIITAAAALEEGVIDVNTTFNCTGMKKVGDREIHCHNTSGHGIQTFAEGIRHSCNPVFMETGLKLGAEKFMEYFSAFGLTRKTGIELPGEAGSIYYTGKMSSVDLATSAFGQGFQVTPLQLITAISAVINGGNLMKPHIVKEIRNDSGIIKSYQPEVVNTVISKQTSDTMRELLETVVSAPDGTAKNAYIKGYRIGGKTGTSEKGNRNEGKRIASFVGFAPAEDPQVICLVMLDEPQVDNKYGGTLAAPLVGSILEDTLDYLGVEREYTEGEEPDVLMEVPDLRGLTLEEAQRKAEKSGFACKIDGKGDTVVSQLPKPGITLKEKSSIVLYTEEQEDDITVTVPDVSGYSIEEARSRITNAGLNFEIVGAGQIDSSGSYAFKQSIEPGQKVAPSTVVGVEFRHASTD